MNRSALHSRRRWAKSIPAVILPISTISCLLAFSLPKSALFVIIDFSRSFTVPNDTRMAEGSDGKQRWQIAPPLLGLNPAILRPLFRHIAQVEKWGRKPALCNTFI
jgi:hypothetical protein